MNIKCIFGHKYGEWVDLGPYGRYGDKLKRTCVRCGKSDIYNGLTERCIINNKKIPYINKD